MSHNFCFLTFSSRHAHPWIKYLWQIPMLVLAKYHRKDFQLQNLILVFSQEFFLTVPSFHNINYVLWDAATPSPPPAPHLGVTSVCELHIVMQQQPPPLRSDTYITSCEQITLSEGRWLTHFMMQFLNSELPVTLLTAAEELRSFPRVELWKSLQRCIENQTRGGEMFTWMIKHKLQCEIFIYNHLF